MPLVSSSIPNLVNGVSQQPAILRLASQAELQENGLSTVAQGLKKRPPTQHVKRLGNQITGSAYIHTINRDTNERYEVVITNGDLKVYDMDGNEKPVAFPNGKAYLGAVDPSTTFRAITVADYTFILNKAATVQKSAALTPTRDPEALVIVKSGQYGKTYKIIKDNFEVASYTTPDGSDPSHVNAISTDRIATELALGLQATSVPFSRVGSVIRVYQSADFNIRVEDGYYNQAMYVVKGKVQRFSDLPAVAHFDGFQILVAGDPDLAGDDYWVRYETANSGGVWREVVAPGVSVGFMGHTMVNGLVREADGSFTLKHLGWSGRVVGDESTAPDPSFVGRKIQDVFFYRNRLGFLADEAMVLSEAGEFFNFYRTTVTQLLDSDPIDVSASHTKVSLLNYAVPFQKKLLLFSSQTQFSVNSGDILTPKTVSINPTTEFECSPQVAPVGVGRNVYFVVPRGSHEGVREYFIATDTDTEDASDVTGHVPTYLPQGIYKIAAALNEDLLCFLTWEEREAIYVYRFYWNNNEKLQSSWSKWVFPPTDRILHAEFIQSELYLIINRDSGLYLERLSVAPEDFQEGEPYPVHLDRKVYLPASGHTFDGERTYLSMGWAPDDGEYTAVVARGQPRQPGILLDVLTDEEGDAYVNGNYANCDLIVGRRYTFRYVFSPLLIRTNSQQGQKTDTVGRLQIRNMKINFEDTGLFQAKVTPYGRGTYTYTYSGKTLGVDSATMGQVGIEGGQYSFPVLSQNSTVHIELVSDSPLPCAFMSADWEGYYVRRSQAV